jgi:hypothetical protein
MPSKENMISSIYEGDPSLTLKVVVVKEWHGKMPHRKVVVVL